MKTLHDIQPAGKRVLLRADFNVPMGEDGEISDDIRIRMVLPTIRHIVAAGGRLIICSHLGRPKGKVVAAFSLAPVARHLAGLLERPVDFIDDCIGAKVEARVQALVDGEILLLENLRFYGQETTNEAGFSAALAALADIYVNDAFAVSHRAHASVVGVAELVTERCAGFLLQTEMDYFHKALAAPRRPLVALVGGAKVSSKLGALENMLDKVDRMVIGGAMANTFLKSQGIEVGASLVEEELLPAARQLVASAETRGVQIYLPEDVVVADRFAAEAAVRNVRVEDIPAGWMALDIGPATIARFTGALADAGTIIWNGPMGAFEMAPFARGTMELCRAVAESPALSIVGGGDSNAAVKMAGQEENISYMSTGGGAFLELMEGKTLPGVAALE